MDGDFQILLLIVFFMLLIAMFYFFIRFCIKLLRSTIKFIYHPKHQLSQLSEYISKLDKKSILFAIILFFAFMIIVSLSTELDETNMRLSAIEGKLGGEKIIGCSEESLKDTLSKNVVRIIGGYSEGSGFPLNKYQIITSFHVIDGDPSPKVVFPDGTIRKATDIVGSREEDIAILTLDIGGDLKTFPTPTADTKFGETLYAAGYALGSDLLGDVSISKGIFNGTRYSKGFGLNLVQSDISLVPGMSGGPLVNSCGEVLGINTEGLSGLSLFVSYNDALSSSKNLTNEEVAHVEIDTSTPLGVVEAFYAYIKSRDLTKAYRLISKSRLDGESFHEWSKGYSNTLFVNEVLAKVDEQDPNKIDIRFESGDWVDGELVHKYFEGYWIVDEDLKLSDSKINTVENPNYWWFIDWEEPNWDL